MTKEEDIALIEKCINNCKLSQSRLFNVFSPRMYGICLSYAKNRDAAKDILQEGFIKVFRNLNSFVHETSLESWIRRIIINTAIDHYRKSIKVIWVRQDLSDELEYSADPDVLAKMEARQILTLVQELPEGYKMVFNLYVAEGFTHKEIGYMLGISEGTSKSQFFHAKKMLQDKVNKLYREISTAEVDREEVEVIYG